MKSDPSEYKAVIEKLLEKTRDKRVQWERTTPGSFRCGLGSERGKSVYFTVTWNIVNDFRYALQMEDAEGNEIFEIVSSDLPTSETEEEILNMIEEIYRLARRQALKVDKKLDEALTLLDQA